MSAKSYTRYREAFNLAKREHILQVTHPTDENGIVVNWGCEHAVLLCYHTTDNHLNFVVRSSVPGYIVKFSSSLDEAMECAKDACNKAVELAKEIRAQREARA